MFLISFVLLYFELLCIRWIPAYIRYLSFFSNVILLGAFLGMGIGMLCARRKANFMVAFAPLLLVFVFLVNRLKFEMKIDTSQALYFTSEVGRLQFQTSVESFFLLPFVFVMVMLLFICLGQPLGRLLPKFPPLTAYSISIAGNLAGIALFMMNGWLETAPEFWFSVLTLALALWWLSERNLKWLALAGLLLVAVTAQASRMSAHTLWSPYYKITMDSRPDEPGLIVLNVNNIGHQIMAPLDSTRSQYYGIPYRLAKRHFDDVLIIGAGSGMDTDRALAENAGHVDAVEIDPMIARIGRELHPNKPYSDPRVRVTITDGRNFLENSKDRYDLIIYALTDSLTLTSSVSSLRLESFLFTREAFERVKAHLNPGGIVAFYNWYRQPWLIAKIRVMLSEVFGEPVFVLAEPGTNRALIMSGEGAKSLNFSLGEDIARSEYPVPATDDWPFLYLKEPGIPVLYLKALGVIMMIALLAVFGFAPPEARGLMEPHFFFLGAAFLLLETQSVIKFSLLFGSTWLVNALVFFALLVLVLIANWIVSRREIRRPRVLYILLFAVLAANFLVPVSVLASGGAAVRYVAATAFLLSPVFLANLIFSSSFKGTVRADVSLASNLLGALVGGICEYLSLLTGYRALTLLVAAFYLLALWRRPAPRPINIH
ncbi:MAG: spermidine synthase [bacterium]